MNSISIASRGYAGNVSGLSIAGRGYYGTLLTLFLTKATLAITSHDIGSAFPNVKIVVQTVLATLREFVVNRDIRSWSIDAAKKDFSIRLADKKRTVELRDKEIVIPPANRKKDEGPDAF